MKSAGQRLYDSFNALPFHFKGKAGSNRGLFEEFRSDIAWILDEKRAHFSKRLNAVRKDWERDEETLVKLFGGRKPKDASRPPSINTLQDLVAHFAFREVFHDSDIAHNVELFSYEWMVPYVKKGSVIRYVNESGVGYGFYFSGKQVRTLHGEIGWMMFKSEVDKQGVGVNLTLSKPLKKLPMGYDGVSVLYPEGNMSLVIAEVKGNRGR